jgi:hypothetical protein
MTANPLHRAAAFMTLAAICMMALTITIQPAMSNSLCGTHLAHEHCWRCYALAAAAFGFAASAFRQLFHPSPALAEG